MNRQDDQELWDLLAHASEPKISPFFARNVLREIRQFGGWRILRQWISIRRLLPAAGVAVALIAVSFLQMETHVVPSDPESDLFTNVDPQDYEVVADLNDVLASDDNSSLEETILR